MDLSKRHFLQLLGAGATLAIAGAGSALTGASNAMAEMVSKLKLSDAELSQRRKEWKKPPVRINYGALGKYASMALSADKGAVLKWD